MTQLEYVICEAESNGEISIDTRNRLLLTLYEKEESDIQSDSELIDKYIKKKNANSIIGRIISQSNSSEERAENLNEELKVFDRLISYASKQKEHAPDKIPFKQILKAGSKAGLKSAGAAVGVNAVGNKLGVSNATKTVAIAGTSTTIANNASQDIPRTKRQWEDVVKYLEENKRLLTTKFYPLHQKLKSKGK